MNWFRHTLKDALTSLFGTTGLYPIQAEDASMDSIRQAMLDSMGPRGASQFPLVQLRVSYANDIQDLWYLRGDLMRILADLEGEAKAKAKILRISDMFKGLLPSGLSSRPSPLGV